MDIHPPLARNHTTPVTSSSHSRFPNSTSSSQHHKSGHTSTFSTFSRGTRASNSTQHTTASTLWSPASATSSAAFSTNSDATIKSNGSVTASNNVINRVADKGTSLFQFCQTLMNRLRAVPGIDEELEFTIDTTDESDPVSYVWKTFRRGRSLVILYNALQPEKKLGFGENITNESKREKDAIYKFFNACMSTLDFPRDQCPTVGDLTGDDTTGFTKVVRIVGRVLDILDERGIIDSRAHEDASDAGMAHGKKTKRQHVTEELVGTERTYVQHLELLNDFKRHVEERSVIPGDAIHSIFLNLGALLDFQRRFLIRVEQVNTTSEDEQDWGQLFLAFNTAFKVYEWYIANQKNCEDAAMRHFDKLQQAGGSSELRQIVESQTHFTSFLLKPFQRLAKYPLLLKELRNTGEFDGERVQSLLSAEAAVVAILNTINHYIKQQEKQRICQDLSASVDNWKGMDFSTFGELVLHGAYNIQKTNGGQQEREYKLYLFEKILLCCKDMATSKKSKLLAGNKPPSIGPRASGKPKLNLKGRLFLFNLEEVVAMSKPDYYVLRLNWTVDEGANTMSIRFPTDQDLQHWKEVILAQQEIARRLQREAQERRAAEQERFARRRAGSHDDEFEFSMQTQGELENPYRDDGSLYSGSGYPSRLSSREDLSDSMSQYPSDGSLRSRSAAGDQHAATYPPIRGPPGRQQNGPPLTVRTQQMQGPSPMDRGGTSYFSPGGESPMSSRTSSSSGMIPFPRQPTPQNGASHDDHNRYTAPAPVTRPLHNSSQGGYNQQDPRGGGRAPGQPMPMHNASLAQTRMRSASSPNVQSQHAMSQQATANAPPVPSVPAHLAGQQPPVNRSQNTTPVYANGVPSRYPTQSPNPKGRQASQGRTDHLSMKSSDGSIAQSHDPRASQQTMSSFDALSPQSTRASGFISGGTHPIQFRIKVKVESEGSTFMLVVASNISFDTLRDRIDAKLQRTTNLTFQASGLKLQFVDEEDDEFMTMQNDDDVQTVFDQWRENHARDSAMTGQFGEITLYCNK